MLGRHYRLRSRRDFNRLYRMGRVVRSPHLLVRALPNHQTKIRVAAVVSTKIDKRATGRNRLRRRLLGQLRPLLARLVVGHDLLIIPQRGASELAPSELAAELTLNLERLELLEP